MQSAYLVVWLKRDAATNATVVVRAGIYSEASPTATLGSGTPFCVYSLSARDYDKASRLLEREVMESPSFATIRPLLESRVRPPATVAARPVTWRRIAR